MMAQLFTSPTASVAVVEATSKSPDAGGIQMEAGNGCHTALVPDAVPLKVSGDALEPPAKRVCFSGTIATPPNKFVNLQTIPQEPDQLQVAANGNLDSLTRQSKADIRDTGLQLEPAACLFSLAQLDELKALAKAVLLGADETPCRSRVEGLGVLPTNLLLSAARDVVSGLFAASSSAALFKSRRINREKAITFLLYAAVGADFPDDVEVAGKAGARVLTHLKSGPLAKRRSAVGVEAMRQLREAQEANESPAVLDRIERDKAEKLAAIDDETYPGLICKKVCAEIGPKIAPLAVAPVAVVTRGAGHVDPDDAQQAALDQEWRQEWITDLQEREAQFREFEKKLIEGGKEIVQDAIVAQDARDAAVRALREAERENKRLRDILAEHAREAEEEEQEEDVQMEILHKKNKVLAEELADARAELADLADWRSMRILEIQRRLMCPKM